ncbi:mab-10, partial [Pristionchus pacificus]|uniref:Mab-10 n=1 Tax=Pristionchus pacificus TaxID=54126 RepID=A0A2A6B3Q6_PRIPA
ATLLPAPRGPSSRLSNSPAGPAPPPPPQIDRFYRILQGSVQDPHQALSGQSSTAIPTPPAILFENSIGVVAICPRSSKKKRIKSVVDPIDACGAATVIDRSGWCRARGDVSKMSSSTTADQAQTPSPSSSSTTASTAAQNRSSQPAKPPSTVSEWQLLAILHRANLLQYYDVFIDKGGDDVNQIMCSEESEFLEIMSIVGMLSKPLHVRRLQRALAQYSNDPTAFNIAAIPHIGAPPVSAYPIGLGATDPVQLFNPVSLSALTSVSASLPSVAPSSSSSSSALPSSSSTSTLVPPSLPTPVCSIAATIDAVASVPAITAPSPNGLLMSSSSSPIPVNRTPQFAQLQLLSSIGGTANVLQGDYLQDTMITRSLQYLMENNQHTSTTSPSPLHDDFVALGDFDPNADTGETPVLSDAQIGRLNACSQAAVAKLAPRPPKLVQNKKKISQDIVDLMAMQPMHPRRHDEYRKYSAIYGRFDAKRKADKALTLHEVSINEAAAQICMLAPALLTRRDELFTLSRQVVKDAGYHYTKSTSTGMPRSASSTETATQGTSRKRVQSEAPTEGAASSPRSQTSASPPLNVVDEDPSPSGSGASKRAKNSPHVGAPKSLLDKWAADRIAKTSFDAPGTSTDPK